MTRRAWLPGVAPSGRSVSQTRPDEWKEDTEFSRGPRPTGTQPTSLDVGKHFDYQPPKDRTEGRVREVSGPLLGGGMKGMHRA